FAIGMQAAAKARIAPGDVAVVIGSGTIGIMVALAALAGGCARVIVSDLVQEKLDIVVRYKEKTKINSKKKNLAEEGAKLTGGGGADGVGGGSGRLKACEGRFELVRPGGGVVVVGMPVDPVPFD